MKHKHRGPHNPLQPVESEYCLVGEKKKRKYRTQLDAELAAPSRELEQYICEYCGTWHNGTPHNKKTSL